MLVAFPRKPVMCPKHVKEEMKFVCEDCQLSSLSRLHCHQAQWSPSMLILEDVSEHEWERISSQECAQEVEDVLGSLEGGHCQRDEKMKHQVNQTQEGKLNEEITNAFKEIYSSSSSIENNWLHDQNEEIAIAKMTALDMQIQEFGVLKEKVVFATQVASGTVDYTAAELLSTKKVIQQELEE